VAAQNLPHGKVARGRTVAGPTKCGLAVLCPHTPQARGRYHRAASLVTSDQAINGENHMPRAVPTCATCVDTCILPYEEQPLE